MKKGGPLSWLGSAWKTISRGSATPNIASVEAVETAQKQPGKVVGPATGGSGFQIQPQAVVRWMGPDIKYYTPSMTESIIREAVMGDLTRQWEMFDLMERTWPRLSTNLKKLRDRTCSVEWTVRPFSVKGKPPTPEAQRKADMLEHAIWSMRPDVASDENDFCGLLFDLCDGWGKGISVQEIDWQLTSYDGQRLVVPRASRWVHPRFYGYPSRVNLPDKLMLRSNALTNERRSDSRDQRENDWRPLDPAKFLLGISKQKSGHPLGAAMFQPLAFLWGAMNFSWEWYINFAQVFGMPIRWATYAATADEDTKRKVAAMLENVGSLAWGMFPEGTMLQFIEAMKTGTGSPQADIIDRADAACDIIVLGQTLTSDAKDHGTQALGTVHAGVLSDREKAQARWAANCLNTQFVPAWMRLNFGDDSESPTLLPDIEEEEDAKVLAETFEILTRSGMKIPAQYAHDRLGIPMAKDGEAVLEARTPTPMPGMPGPPSQEDSTDRPEAETQTGPEEGREENVEARSALVTARHEQDVIAMQVAELVTQTEAKWLKGAVPWFRRLIAAAEDPDVTDDQFEALIVRTRNNLPDELAPLLDADSLATAMEKVLGAGVVNGATSGHNARKRAAREALR